MSHQTDYAHPTTMNGANGGRAVNAQPSLPSIHALGVPVISCHGCGLTFDRWEQRDPHRAVCPALSKDVVLPFDARLGHTRSSSGSIDMMEGMRQAMSRAIQVRPEREAEGHSNSQAYPLGGDSSPSIAHDDSSHAYQLESSRRSSTDRLATPRRGSSQNVAFAPTPNRGEGPSNQKNEKRKHKMMKERESREQQARVLQCSEDLLQNYVCLESRNTQSSGNGNEAGLEGVKIDCQKGNLRLLNYFIHRDHMQALKEDRLLEWQEEMRRIFEQTNDNLTAGTWLGDVSGRPFEPCEHDRGSKACTKHGHPDHRRCRKDRARRNYRLHKQEWESRHGGMMVDSPLQAASRGSHL